MKGLDQYVGQVLDEKYRLERLLGSGGMGAVFLATHLGTERYVALKLIAPEFMRNEEFVERFKREARAAGRLRHPNVVDVTDFGFGEARGEQVAYLVMEYLDGCTLGDVLEEEKRLPVEWVVDILEQVCSAVHEAHQQGIIHRDLKPDNIWLEPNRLGGYRVKVLDFGIAKLGESAEYQKGAASTGDGSRVFATSTAAAKGGSTQMLSDVVTQPDMQRSEAATLVTAGWPNETNKATNLAQDGEDGTLLLHSGANEEPVGKQSEDQYSEDVSTKLFNQEKETRIQESLSSTQQSDLENFGGAPNLQQTTIPMVGGFRAFASAETTKSTELTRLGAIMGTPIYMSPEQCAGKNLDARSDIYSLGVIAYQTLAGAPPFAGQTDSVIREHKELPPPPLRERNKKVPKRVAEIVMAALSKDPGDRPPTAIAFSSALRSQATSIGSLYRRAFALYSEHFPKFLKLSLTAHLPFIVTTILLVVLQLAEQTQRGGWGRTRIILVCALGLVALVHVVVQFLAAATISGVTAVIVTQLSAAPLRPVELRSVIAVLKRRWKPFLKTAIRVTLRIILGYVLLIIPGLILTVRYALWAPVVLLEGLEGKAAIRRARELASRSWRTVIIVSILQVVIPMVVGGLIGKVSVDVSLSGSPQPKNQIFRQLTALVNVFVVPLMSIVPALLYLKMRQLGGEDQMELLAPIEATDDRRSKWQQRMRSRLSLHTPRSR
jgi:serine/threonine protein kinase